MNIFYIDKDPRICAQQHCDKHVVKMIVEYAQLLSTAHRVIDGVKYDDKAVNGRRIVRWKLPDNRDTTIYKSTHSNHPSAKWVRQSSRHYDWLFELWVELLNEFNYRYNKDHKSGVMGATLLTSPKGIEDNGWVDPPPAMPDSYKVDGDSVLSYRNFYIHSKSKFATWKAREVPPWFTLT